MMNLKKNYLIIATFIFIVILLVYFFIISSNADIYTNNIKLINQNDKKTYSEDQTIGYKYKENEKYILCLDIQYLMDKKLILTKEQYDKL